MKRLNQFFAGIFAVLSAGACLGGVKGGEADVAWMTPDEVQATLKQGEGAMEDGFHGLAREKFLAVLERSAEPRWSVEGGLRAAQALREEAEGLLGGQDADRAAGLFAQGAEILDRLEGEGAGVPGFAVRLAMERARREGAQGHWERSWALLEPLDDAGEEGEVLPLRLRAAMELGRWADAEAVAEEMTHADAEGSTAPMAWIRLAARMADAGETGRAHGVLRRMAKQWAGKAPWGETAALHDAELGLEDGTDFDADGWLKQVDGATQWLSATRAKGYLVAAQAYLAQGRSEPAVRAAEAGERAAESPELREAAKRLRAQAQAAEGDLDALSEIVREGGEASWAGDLQLQLAEALSSKGEHEEALETYQAWLEAREGGEQTFRALLGLARELTSEERLDEAAQTLNRAEKLAEGGDVPLSELLMDEARLYAAGGSDQRALEKYEQAAAAAGDDRETALQAQLLAGDIRERLGETKEAEETWLELSRQTQWGGIARAAMKRLGRMYEARGALESSVEQYGRLAEAAEDAAERNEALMARGLILYQTGAFQGALDDFSAVQTGGGGESGEEARALYMSGWCLEQLGEQQAAKERCEEFLEKHPESPYAQDVYFWLGEKEYNAGHYPQAEGKFMKLAGEHPESEQAPEALYWAGRAAMAQHENLRANDHFNQFMADYPKHARHAAVQLSQGDVLSELGYFPQAVAAFDAVITEFPQTAEAQMARGRKGDCLFALGTEDAGHYELAYQTYQTLTGSEVPLALKLGAMYKSGRCLEKKGQATQALAVYADTLYTYLTAEAPTAEAAVWFTKAAFDAAALQEKARDRDGALRTYQHVVDAGVPAKAEAEERIGRLRSQRGER